MTIEIVTLHGVPLYDGDEEDKHGVPASVKALQERVETGRRHHHLDARVQFFLSRLSEEWPGLDVAVGQPVQMEACRRDGASEGAIGTARSQYHLRQNLVGLEAITMPKPEIFVALAPKKFAEGKLTDEATKKLIATWLAAFKDWVKRG